MTSEKFFEEFRLHLKDGLNGGDTHLNTKDAIEKLPFDIVNKRIAPNVSTIWEIFYHMIFWQKLLVMLLLDDDTSFKENIELKSFPEKDCDEKTLKTHKKQFMAGLETIAKLVDTLDFSHPTPSWSNVQKYKIMQILLQHNSYHLGQLILIQKSLPSE
ncbi:MAG: DinB family protein [Candidatus Heimdallarchaeota archaeon]|nr:DinB family protein [Candidatus Heimdallarchaeota archaeon]MCK4289923.1 DinB family protein [Candidatus Heimdallarchaeota archaeon]